jgi:hypothetical protein
VELVRDGKGEVRGKLFCFFSLKAWANPADIFCVNRHVISALFLTLACVDVLILSQFSLGFIEALLTGSLMLISYGMGIFSGLAE